MILQDTLSNMQTVQGSTSGSQTGLNTFGSPLFIGKIFHQLNIQSSFMFSFIIHCKIKISQIEEIWREWMEKLLEAICPFDVRNETCMLSTLLESQASVNLKNIRFCLWSTVWSSLLTSLGR